MVKPSRELWWCWSWLTWDQSKLTALYKFSVMSEVESTHMSNPLMSCCVVVCVYICAVPGQVRRGCKCCGTQPQTVLWFTQSWPAGISRLWVWHHAAGGHAGPLNVTELRPRRKARGPKIAGSLWNWTLWKSECICVGVFGKCCIVICYGYKY